MEETKEMVSMCYITGEGGTLATPRLCLHLHRTENVVSRIAHQLFDHCLEKVPDAPARKEVSRKDVKHGELLQELHSRGYFLDADITAYGRLEAGDLGAGDVTAGPIEAIGLSSNLKTRDRAFALAMSMAILLRLEPGTANMICNFFGARQQRGLFTVKTKLPTDEEIFRFQMALTTWPRGNPSRFLRFEQLEEAWLLRPKGKGSSKGKSDGRPAENRILCTDPEEQRKIEDMKIKREEVASRKTALLANLTNQIKAIMAKISDASVSEAKRETLRTLLLGLKEKLDSLSGPKQDYTSNPLTSIVILFEGANGGRDRCWVLQGASNWISARGY
eukprot:s5_g34.t1